MLEIPVPQHDQEKTTSYHKNHYHLTNLWVYGECVVGPRGNMKDLFQCARPPSTTMKALTWLNIAFIQSDIVGTCSSSPIVFPMMFPFAKAFDNPQNLTTS